MQEDELMWETILSNATVILNNVFSKKEKLNGILANFDSTTAH